MKKNIALKLENMLRGMWHIRGRGEVHTGFSEWKGQLGRSGRRWEDNIWMNVNKIGCDGVEWIDLALDWEYWRALVVNAVMNLRVP